MSDRTSPGGEPSWVGWRIATLAAALAAVVLGLFIFVGTNSAQGRARHAASAQTTLNRIAAQNGIPRSAFPKTPPKRWQPFDLRPVAGNTHGPRRCVLDWSTDYTSAHLLCDLNHP